MVGTCYLITVELQGIQAGGVRGPCSGVRRNFVGDVDEGVSVKGFDEVSP